MSKKADNKAFVRVSVFGIFLCSLSAISFEIALTRIFSISIWHHFAFMVISIAMLGIAAGGTALAVFPGLKRINAGFYALGLAAAIPLGYMLANIIPFDPARLSWDSRQIFYIAFYYAVLSIPFFFFGLIMSSSFAAFGERAGRIYGADLIGAGAGSAAVIALMNNLSPEACVFLISSGALCGAFLMGIRRGALTAAFIVAAVFFVGGKSVEVRMSEHKGLQMALKYPGAEHIKTYNSAFSRVDVFQSPLARFAPGLSLRYLDPLPRQVGISVDGSDLSAITEGNADAFLRHLPSALPYEMFLGRKPDVLVMEPKGGLPILLAQSYGANEIFSMDSNPLMVDVIKKDYGVFSGDIYAENAWKGLARGRLMTMRKSFDIIDISLLSAVPSGGFGISEDYRFTVEAFREYLSHLKPGGVLSMSVYIFPPPRTEFRLLSTVLSALKATGADDTEASRMIAAIRSWATVSIIAKAGPLTEDEIGAIREFTRRNGFDIVYYPGVKEEETNIYVKIGAMSGGTAGTPPDLYYEAFRRLIDPQTRKQFQRDYLFDIGEVGDDAPFFHHYLRLKNAGEIYKVMGGKWQYFIEEGYLLPAVLVQAVFFGLLLLIAPALRARPSASDASWLAYFALLGMAFMFVEIPLIQTLILPLETPSYAVAVSLASVLVSSGAGSYLSERIKPLSSPYAVLALAALLAPYGLLISRTVGAIAAFPMAYKIVLSFVIISPIGFLMGIPFPLGMRRLARMRADRIPWAWAVNGCFSVIAPMAAVMSAMAVGFKGVFIIGAAMYAGAFLLLGLTRHGHE